MNTPSHKALVPFVSVKNMMQLVHRVGIEKMLAGLEALGRKEQAQNNIAETVLIKHGGAVMMCLYVMTPIELPMPL